MVSELRLVDVSAWIPALRKKPNRSVKERIDTLLAENAVAVAEPVKLELLGGTKLQDEFERLKRRLDALQQLDVGRATWERATRLAFDLRRTGITVSYIDALMVAIAIEHEAVLLHADSDFDLISRESDLRVESFARRL